MHIICKKELRDEHASCFVVENSTILPSKAVKILGVTADAVLSSEEHISCVVRKCNKIIFSLYSFRHYFTSQVLKAIIQAYVFPHLLSVRLGWGGQAADAQASKSYLFFLPGLWKG